MKARCICATSILVNSIENLSARDFGLCRVRLSQTAPGVIYERHCRLPVDSLDKGTLLQKVVGFEFNYCHLGCVVQVDHRARECIREYLIY